MTWADELTETKRKKDSIVLSDYSDDSEFMLVNDFVLAVLKEYSRIVDESNRDFAEDDVEHEIEYRLASMTRELIKKCQELKKK